MMQHYRAVASILLKHNGQCSASHVEDVSLKLESLEKPVELLGRQFTGVVATRVAPVMFDGMAA